jgi:hypothetical protein
MVRKLLILLAGAVTTVLPMDSLADAAPKGRFVEHAGVGGPVGYARAGVLELGGSAGLTVAADLRDVTFSPIVGWFVADSFQLSAILNLSYVSNGDDSSGVVSALVEPSYHLPFDPNVYGFLGLGLGGAYVADLGGGFALAPRLGANILVGRSGILTPSMSWQYTTHDVDTMNGGATSTATLAVSSALRMNVGYTVMW